MCAGINDLEKFLHNKIVYKSHVLNVRHSFFFFSYSYNLGSYCFSFRNIHNTKKKKKKGH